MWSSLRGLARVLATPASLATLLLSPAAWAMAKHDAAVGSAATVASVAAPVTVRVESFSPQGYVRHVRQVVVRFSAPMVALGDPRLADPFTASCPARGKGRWADTRNWVFDFDADLDAGVRCRFALKQGLKSSSGAPVAGRRSFRFETGGPAIVASLPRDGWAEIDEEQVFIVRLDAQARRSSIEAHAYCAVDGLAERVPVRVLTGPQRQQILDERRALGYDYLWLLWKNGIVSTIRARDRTMERREAVIAVLQCKRRLPPGTRVLLHWGAGIASPSGIATRQDQQLAFRVRPAFIAQVECMRTNPRAGCVPMQPVSVTFSAPVPRALALGIRIGTRDGKLLAPAAPPNSRIPTLEEVTFSPPFPESTTVSVTLPPGFVDDAGRKLENAARFPLGLRVDAYPPLAKFSGTFGILEAREGGVLPVTLRNVEPTLDARQTRLPGKVLRIDADAGTIANWLTRVESAAEPRGEWVSADEMDDPRGLKPKLVDQDLAEAEEGTSRPRRVWRDTTGSSSVFGPGDSARSFTIDKPAGRRPEEVLGIALRQPGFYVVELASRALGAATLGAGRTRYVATSALVTDLAVHFLWGRESSLVWVTRLSTGRPVAGAAVAISDFCSGITRWQGHTGPDGIARVGQSLGDAPSGFGSCSWDPPLLVLAKVGNDFSFTESTWSQGIGPYEFGLPVGREYTANIYDTVLDRTLFRAGETVSMQHFLRRHVSAGLAIQPAAAGTHRIVVRHLGSGQEYTWDAVFDHAGIATSRWKIPPEAKLGDYVVLIDDHRSAEFQVEQFRLPSMRGSVVGPAQPLIAPREVALDLHVAYLSGGGAAALPVKVRALVEPQPMQFPGYPDYAFGGNPVEEGITTLGQGRADFDFEPDETPAQAQAFRTQTIPLTLDGSGSAHLLLSHLPAIHDPSRLTAQLEYADADGELMTTAAYVRLLPAAVSLGIRPESWIGSPDQLRFRVVALGPDGKPRAGQPVVVALYQSSAYSYRKRLIGGFYAYETVRETKRLAAGCRGRTNAQGLLLCDVVPGASGEIVVRAEAQDTEGHIAGATTSMWVFDGDGWWFGGTSGDRMDVLPEKKEYQAGDTARFQVRMPFREATALVTVEREGVMRSFVTRLRGKAPIVEVPIKDTDAPNVFVSVLAVRGRVAHAEPGIVKSQAQEVTALVDLTKPAYRLGIAQIRVGWRPHRLEVQVQPAHSVYRVRERVGVRIHVARADGQPLPSGGEVAVAAVDEALLDLLPNDSWKLLQAMMGQRGLEVWTSTAQMQVVGKRHYGRKAVPVGGGGGRSPGRTRELFDSLLLWQARIPLDAQGNASVTIPLNDSLSAFRIVAVADDGAELYGTASATIHTTQDLILTSGLPPLVREGDHYAATFTVRNTTDHPIDASMEAVSRAAAGSGQPQTVRLAAGQARDLTWPARAPVGAGRIDWDVTVRDTSGSAHDRLEVAETEIPAYPVRTYQATIAQLTSPLTFPVERPRDAAAGRGGLDITLQPRLAGSLEGVREYMGRYPYICLEQRVSKAIALGSLEQWDAVMAILPAYMDEDGLLKYFPSDDLEGDDGLTAYVLSIAHEAGWSIPSGEGDRMLHALAAFVEGRIVRDSALPTADLSIRKLQAIAALARYGMAEPDMLDSITLEPNLMPTSALLDWIDILGRVSGVPRAEEKQSQAFGILRARLNFQGTTMGFSTERTDALWWLMISEDSNANRMVLAALDRPRWREDMPRLVRGALGRQREGHWNTTVANAWGMLAMKKFSAVLESTPVGGATLVRYGSEQRVVSWPRPENVTTTDLPWEEGKRLLDVRHQGSGAPWVMVRAMAAIPLHEPLSSGFRITRTMTPIEQSRPGVWTRGDVARVHLALEAQSDMTWVVVNDPIPAGATILGSGLGGQSQLLTRGERRRGWAWLAYEERRFDGYRAYYEFVPKGHWSVEYTVRFDNPGTFQLPTTRVEAMYAPEMFGELPNAPITVQPGAAVR